MMAVTTTTTGPSLAATTALTTATGNLPALPFKGWVLIQIAGAAVSFAIMLYALARFQDLLRRAADPRASVDVRDIYAFGGIAIVLALLIAAGFNPAYIIDIGRDLYQKLNYEHMLDFLFTVMIIIYTTYMAVTILGALAETAVRAYEVGEEIEKVFSGKGGRAASTGSMAAPGSSRPTSALEMLIQSLGLAINLAFFIILLDLVGWTWYIPL